MENTHTAILLSSASFEEMEYEVVLHFVDAGYERGVVIMIMFRRVSLSRFCFAQSSKVIPILILNCYLRNIKFQ